MPRNQLRTTESRSLVVAGRSPIVASVIGAAVLGIGAVAYVTTADVGGNDMAIAPVDMPALADREQLAALAQPVSRGNPDAPITIMEFGDYQCPSCRFFQQQVEPQIQQTYLQDGQAKFDFYDFPLNIHQHSFLAARAARCAGDQQKYWEYHDALYINQPTWSISAAPARLFLDYARGLGLDEGTYESCLRSDRFADVVTANLRLAEELNLPGTPSIMVRGTGLPKRVDWSSLETLFQTLSASIDSLRQAGG